jgi:hypothetical protein
MKKTMIILMLFAVGVLLFPANQVFAEDVPDEDIPELFDSSAQTTAFDIGTVCLDEDPVPDPEPEPCE